MIQLHAQAVLTDIEGTTTAIDFVHETLFPYARQALPEFVRRNAQDPQVRGQLQATAELAEWPDSNVDKQTAQLIDILLSWIDQDRKATPLKALQGMIWKHGYEQGEFRGHVYPDTHQKLQAWHQGGLSLNVYSSGSVAAQQLLYGHSDFGDMRPLFSGWFDTTSGPKIAAESYRNIVAALPVAASETVFLSDVVAELDAAAEAGMQTVQLCRTSGMQTGHHPVAESFDPIEILA